MVGTVMSWKGKAVPEWGGGWEIRKLLCMRQTVFRNWKTISDSDI